MSLRRLPVYLLLDCSGSMAGEGIEQVRQGMHLLLEDLRMDPQAVETAYLSIITFDSSAKQIVPLTELMAFQEPQIDAGGTTSLGEALEVLEKAIDREVQKSTPTQKGDWKPLIFLMTDGLPTDNWEPAAKRLKQSRPGNIIACAVADADTTILKQITEIVVQINNQQQGALTAFFRWVSSSIKSTSQSLAQVVADQPISLPPAPPQIQIVP